MKITVYTLVTNTDDGMTVAAFNSEAERDQRAWAFVQSYDPQKNFKGSYDDPQDAWIELLENCDLLDTMCLDAHDLEIPNPLLDCDNENKRRAERAEAAFAAYRDAHPEREDAPLRDLIADLRHWCDLNAVDFDAEHSIALDNFNKERAAA